VICKPLLKLGKDFWKSISIIYNFLSCRKETKKEEMVINFKYKAPDKGLLTGELFGGTVFFVKKWSVHHFVSMGRN